MSWRYFGVRLYGDAAGEVVAPEIPINVSGLTDVLSGPPELAGVVGAAYKDLVADDGDDIFEEYGLAIFAEKDGRVQPGGGIITSAVPNTDGGLEIQCAGYTSYLNGMPYTDSISFVGVDSLDIYRHVWQHVQGQPNGDLGLTIDALQSGTKLGTVNEDVEFQTGAGEYVAFEAGPVKLAWWLTEDLASFVGKLDEQVPFDYHERHWWEGSTLRHHVELGVPLIGTRRTDLALAVGVNVVSRPQYQSAAGEYASGVIALGAGEGRDKVHAIYETPPKRLRRIATHSDPAMQSNSAASAAAVRSLRERNSLPSISELTIRNHSDAPIGSIQLGDELPFFDDSNPWVQTNTFVRVLASRIDPRAEDQAVLTVARTGWESS